MDIDPRQPMLYWAIAFLAIGSVSAVLGSSDFALIPVHVARVLFMVFTLLFIAATVLHGFRDRTPS